ncbi:MAG TPA: 4-hydroxy-3-methylbut-2-enyl diphosphate reductase [Acidobacteriota bacterium]|nr:4-hydroxy-3-methylbut-2-enyl diphosphate reductase [Acidobacteriota bacterium]
MVCKVVLASPRGFCAGVVRAIDIVELALETYEGPLYVRKEIVHNPHVVEDLRRKGVIFVSELDEVPEGQRVIFSAHGVSPEVWNRSQAKSHQVIDATCPLVTKVHMEAKRFASKGYTIILIGHEGHDEVEGTMGEAPGQIVLLSSEGEVEDLQVEDPEKVAFLTQTTLSINDTEAIVAALKGRFPAIEGPPTDDICYATQNRQEAVRSLAGQTDLILVVGAKNSSNSNRLVEEAREKGTRAYLINDAGDIDPGWLEGGVEIVGVTSGASAPDRLVQEVVRYFVAGGAEVEELSTREENVQFALPANLRSTTKAPRAPSG